MQQISGERFRTIGPLVFVCSMRTDQTFLKITTCVLEMYVKDNDYATFHTHSYKKDFPGASLYI